MNRRVRAGGQRDCPPAPEIAEDRRQVLWQDGERLLFREVIADGERALHSVLTLRLTAEHPPQASVDRLAHEYSLRDHLESAWAVSPLELVRDRDRMLLLLDDPGGEPLDWHLGEPMEPRRFLHLAIGIAAALGQVHQRGLIHRDLKPIHILVDGPDGHVHLTGFGFASRLPLERQSLGPPEFIVGTLAYMAPEQTGRMNRSVDSRSDLYALGVTFYQMLTGVLPFSASDPMGWIHCHIAQMPMPPQQRVANIPGPLSQIVIKLLAKTAEDRYQTAVGVVRDLRRCLAEWQARQRIDAFTLGETDTPDHLLIPEKLLGREREIADLLDAYDRVARSGTPELMLICGYSGTGKSSLANELHKALVPSRGLFASGKFDRYTQDIPYKTIAEAFRGPILGLMSTTDAELKVWRGKLSEALGTHGQLVAALVPDLKLIIGEQSPAPDLPPQQARRLFQAALRRFIGAFASPQHPLVLFLDDLHAADAAALDLLEDLMTQSDLRDLLVIGAYRDNEIDLVQPLERKLENIRSAGVKVGQITLKPLGREHIEEFVANALRSPRTEAAPLAELVHRKTDGNPFFVIKFLSALVDKELVAFNPIIGGWSWDLARIRAQAHTDNVIELMVDKLNQLSAETKTALQQLACLGHVAPTTVLATALATSEERVHAALGSAARFDLVERFDNSYRFTHDRVQEAAYSSIPDGQRVAAHWRIGQLMMTRTPPEQRDESILEIVNQLNRGFTSITSIDEREQLAEFNLTAGRRASASTAYAAALNYFVTGRELLAEDCWERRPELTLALDLHRAECELLTGALSDAENHLMALWRRAKDMTDRASVARLRIDLYSMLHQISHSVAAGLDYLKFLGFSWSAHPSDEEARLAYLQLWAELDRRTNDELVALPLMTDVSSLVTLDVMNRLCSPAQFSDINLYTLSVCQMLRYTLDRGNSDASAAAYVRLGMIAGLRLGQYEAAERVGRIAHELIERRGLRRYQAAVYLNYGNLIMPWTRHMSACCELIGQALDTARKTGDLMYAGVCANTRIVNLVAVGEALGEVQREAETALAFAQQVRFLPGLEVLSVALALVRMLRGSTTQFGLLEDGLIREQRLERDFANTSGNSGSECWYWICKLQARFMAGDYVAALEAESRAGPLLNMSLTIMQAADYHLYSALSHAASCNSSFGGKRSANLKALASHHQQLVEWAANCPQNFEDRAAMVGAERARVTGRELEAEQLFARSIRAAHASGFIRNEALANELASRFYAGRHLEDIAEMHLTKARNAYLHWGAEGKARQLEATHPRLRNEALPAATGTIGVPVDHLDLATVIKVSQTVSSEIVLERLIETLLRTAVEQAGAQRGVLMVPRDGELWCVAEGSTVLDSIVVELRDCPLAETSLPQSVILLVERTREAVILDDATAQYAFAADPYISQRQTKSILCLPLVTQAKLNGVLYLENNLAPNVFVQARTAVLKLLASQAAIALENASLYRDIAGREAKIRRLVDANIIGTFIWKAVGPNIEIHDIAIIEANDAFLNMVGYDREDLAAARLTRLTLTPPEWLEGDTRRLVEVKTRGTVLPYEQEYLRKDGSRVPVLVGTATFEHQPDRGVAFVLDLTERKRAENALRRASDKLAQATQAESLAILSASIAHEVNQPLAAIVANSDACYRWLSASPPNVERAKSTAERITSDANSAADVVSRIRALFRRAPLSRSSQEVNGLISEVCRMMAVEIAAKRIHVTTDLAPALPSVSVDRVQIQQVFVNLIRNGIEAMDSVIDGDRTLRIRSCRESRDSIRVEVRDAGTGFKDPERAFEPFFTTKQHGMGMGLAICRSIIESHGGRLWTANNETRGATVGITLRLAVNEPS
jgi:PAS domain S-box-containing protein